MPNHNPLSGFRYAQDGILHCVRTQKHMRMHFFVVVGVLLGGFLFDLDNRDLLTLLFAITLVIITEMLNTSIEGVVDMVTENYSPVAKIAKDVAAGAVLLAALNAIIAGIVIFCAPRQLERIHHRIQMNPMGSELDVTRVLVMGVVLLSLIVIITKILSRTGRSVWHGGAISGHSAIGFLLAMTIFFLTQNPVVAFLAILMAVLVAQSRVEAGVHSLREVVFGAVLAIALTSVVYRGMPFLRKSIVKRPTHTQILHSNPSRLTLASPLYKQKEHTFV